MNNDKVIDLILEGQRESRKETNERFDKLEVKVDALQTFKITTVASARTTSLIVSGICGFITLVATVITVSVALAH